MQTQNTPKRSALALMVDPTQALEVHARQPEGAKFMGFSNDNEPQQKDELSAELLRSRFWRD